MNNICYTEEKNMTRADRIRSMKIEDLAWLLMQFRFDAFGKATGNESALPDTHKAICAWLDQKVEQMDRLAVDVEKALAFIADYAFKDDKEVYTNGTVLVPLFRVKQALVDKAYNGFREGC